MVPQNQAPTFQGPEEKGRPSQKPDQAQVPQTEPGAYEVLDHEQRNRPPQAQAEIQGYAEQLNLAQAPRFASTGDLTGWINPVCGCSPDDVKTTFLGFCCPSILYGKTQYRLRCVHLGEDPFDETGFSAFNLPCLLYYLGVCGVLCALTQHNRIRETYNIKGSLKRDLAKSVCLHCCTLIQADREVRSRAALDEKIAGDGIWVQQPSSTNQKMRYVPEDKLFGAIMNSERSFPVSTSRRPTAVSSPDPALQQDGSPALVTLDGASMALSDEKLPAKKIRDQAAQSIRSTNTVRRASQTKSEKIMPSDGQAKLMSKCANQSIEVKEPGKVVINKTSAVSRAESSDRVKGANENVAVLTEGKRRAADQSALNGAFDETVFVYYNSPSTPQPQKMRDCVKTNTSESLADYKLLLAEKLDRSAAHRSESCSADERLSYEEAPIRAMLEYADPTVYPSTEAVSKEHRQSTQLPKISESSDTQSGHDRDKSVAVNISGPSGYAGEPGNTVIEARCGIPSPSADLLHDIQAETTSDNRTAAVQLHPMTRESNIVPSTPLALEEVAEEINVEGTLKVPQEGKLGAMTMGVKLGRKVRPNFLDGNSEP